MRVFLGSSRIAQQKLYTHLGQGISWLGPRKRKPIARKLMRGRLKKEMRHVVLEHEQG